MIEELTITLTNAGDDCLSEDNIENNLIMYIL